MDLQTIREKLKNAIRKGKAIDAERADLQRQLTALKEGRQATQEASSSPALADAVASAEQRFADQLHRLTSQHKEERDQLQLQVEAMSRQVAEEQAVNAAQQVSQECTAPVIKFIRPFHHELHGQMHEAKPGSGTLAGRRTSDLKHS